MKIKAIITLHVNGKDHAPGALLDIADDEAERLIARGFATSGQEKAASASAPAKPLPRLRAENLPRRLKILSRRFLALILPKITARTASRTWKPSKPC